MTMLKTLTRSLSIGFLRGSFLCCLFASSPTGAQVVLDNTLPQNSIITPQDNIIQIDGGTRAGDNLFHSFEQFSVGIDETAHFNNAMEIQNILSRVTGGSISEINGILKANGVANLFLINPNGIIFGENASLDIGGSFFATSADSVVFANGAEFSATNLNTLPLLTINIPVGLWFRENPGSIVNRSQATITNLNNMGEAVETPIGLQVGSAQTIALVGGDVVFEMGLLATQGGRIELGSVAGNTLVSLTPIEQGWKLGYEGINNFQNINLFESRVGSVGLRGGDIQIQGRNVTIDSSQVISFSLGEGQAGNVGISGSESVELIGILGMLDTAQPAGLFAVVAGDATGQNRTLTVETKRLVIRDGAQISTDTLGTGQGIDLRVNASESVELIGIAETSEDPIASGLFAQVGELETTGEGGTITIETGRLIVRDGAQVSAATSGIGRAGDVIVNALESVELTGAIEISEDSVTSGLFTQVEPGATGDAGNLLIETGQLSILDGAQISSAARNGGQGGSVTVNASESIFLKGTGSITDLVFGSSSIAISAEPAFEDESGNLIITTADAGELTINTPELIVEDGAKISADNFGTGGESNVNLNVGRLTIRDGGRVGAGSLVEEGSISNVRGPGGTLTINASEAVEVTGTGTVGSTPVNSRLFTLAEGTGDAGNLSIFTPNLTVTDGGEVNVSATGSAEAGSLTVGAGSIYLEDGSLSAETRVGNQGNITLAAEDIQLRQGSEITTNSLETGTGGNIEIDTDVLLAIENSDISANALAGSGGQVIINADAIFGTQFRQQQTNASDITATSELGAEFSGTVELNTQFDPSSAVIELPVTVVDPASLIAQEFCRQRGGSEFVNTGRGGLPPGPQEGLSGQDTIVNLMEFPEVESPGSHAPVRRDSTASKLSNQPISSLDIIPAQGWIRDENGDVILVSYDPTKRGIQRQRQGLIQCQSQPED